MPGIDPMTNRPAGDHGTANDALEWVFDVQGLCDSEAGDFLRWWRLGDLGPDFSDFYKWLNETER